MSEKRFQKTRIVDKWGGIYDSKTDKVLNVNDVEHKLNEQQSIIDGLEKSFDDLVQWASEIAKRNVILDERIGRLQQEEKLYAQEILRLNNLLKQYQSNLDLGGDY